jgi:cytochrome c-type biogenesis protein CcmH
MNYWFWILCALVAIVALLFIVLPLWRSSIRNNDVLRDAANLEILRDQMSEMDADLRNGLLTEELYEQGKREIQTRLLDEVKSTQAAAAQPVNSKVLALILAVMLPLFSIPLYLYLGNHDATMPAQEPVMADSSGVVSSDEGIDALANQLRKHPENPDGWFLLASSYIAKQRYSEGADAYEQLVKLVPDEAQVWANYADVYAMAHGRTLQGEKVTEMLGKALELDPSNMSALALSGFAAMERADYAAAITHWQQLVVQFPAGSAEAKNFEGSIQRAGELLAQQPGGKKKLAQLSVKKPAPSNLAAAISGRVSLSKELLGKVNPDDTVFILARAAEGPKMPLAVLRKQVRDLPMEFTLDDSMAMQPQLKLSGFDQVVVVARVSKSGTPMAQPGDIEGMSATVKPGSKGLRIMIDTVVP